MKNNYNFRHPSIPNFLLLLLSLVSLPLFSQTNYWSPSAVAKSAEKSTLLPDLPDFDKGALVQLDLPGFIEQCQSAKKEGVASINNSTQIWLPMPDGSYQRFLILESPLMEPALAAKFPEIKSYLIRGVDDPLTNGRMSVSPEGFGASFTSVSNNNEVFIKKVSKVDATQYISIYGNQLGNFGAGDFSIEAKIKTSATSDYVLSKRGICNLDNFWNILIDPSGRLRLEMCENTSGLNNASVTGTTNIANNAWHHIAVTRTSGTVRLYVNGVLEASENMIANINNATNLKIGTNICGSAYGGQIDELRFWNTARSASQIADLDNAFLPVPMTGLIAYYDFNNAGATGGGNNTGQTALADRTGTYNGIITSGTYQATTELTSDGTVPAGADVTFKAATGIILQPNFTVTLGAIFTTLMQACTP